ncbi:MAG: carbohydrate-binding domain-containing protein [Anaerolineae bacterium]|nr:carbohydrate-binding domain-containing protein [Anaerolineae bacterium]
MKKIIALLWVLVFIVTLPACSGNTVAFTDVPASQPTNASGKASAVAVNTVTQEAIVTPSPISVEYDSDDLNVKADSSDISYIKLEGNSITVDGSGATVEGNIVTITSAGTYNVRGTLNDGQIIVNTKDQKKVKLILNGVDITCSASAPIYVMNAEKTVITLAEGTENYVTDGELYVFEGPASDEPNAAIFSHDDLTINGEGLLTVNANYNNGIASKDDLKITGGNITVNAVNDGIKGKDSLAIKDGTVTVTAGSDALQSYNVEDAEKGYVAIESGVLSLTAGMDGIQAETSVLIEDGDITITAGGGSANSSDRTDWGNWGGRNPTSASNDTPSAKGIKAVVAVTIEAGTINIDASDDTLHSNGSLVINAGDINLASGDDGIHADATIAINGGDINITKSYEGIESAVVTLNGGNIHLVANDDGINIAGGDGSSMNGRPGQNRFSASSNNHLYIHDGYVAIDAKGDGLDVNGSIAMTGGFVLVNGPTMNGNGALDCDGAFEVSGGYLVAAGSAGMAEAPDMSSTQYSVMVNFSTVQPAGTLVHIATEDGEEILTFAPTKEYQSVVLSSSQLNNGSTYVVYTGGSSTGMVTDSLYSGGTYTVGEQVTSFTISDMVTVAGAYGGGFRGGPGGNAPPSGNRRP